MRITLTIDDELAKEIDEVAHRVNKTFQEIVNETLRVGLHPAGASSPKPYRLATVSLGFRPEVNIDKARHIADALEDDEIVRKLSQPK